MKRLWKFIKRGELKRAGISFYSIFIFFPLFLLKEAEFWFRLKKVLRALTRGDRYSDKRLAEPYLDRLKKESEMALNLIRETEEPQKVSLKSKTTKS